MQDSEKSSVSAGCGSIPVGYTGGMKLMLWAMLASLAAAVPSSAAESIRGKASVIDGDTIEIHGERIRLHAIDSPEGRQSCTRGGATWRCGTQAARALDGFIDGATVYCTARDVDRYGRIVATCRAHKVDIGDWMVRNGWALAYRQYGNDYVAAEQVARSAGVGVWSGEVVPPWEWRKAQRN